MSSDVWVLGATGRSGRGIARRLAASGHTPVLAGRDVTRLTAAAADLGGAEVVSGSWEALLARLRDAAPAVVVNTVGPFARTSVPAIDACPPGTDYVDIGNELPGVRAVLERHDRLAGEGSTAVTGAGFGVLATESVVLQLCDGRPAPVEVRVDTVPSVATEQGVVGDALAGSMLDGAPHGGRRVQHGSLVRFPVGGAPLRLTTPSGEEVTTGALPTGDLFAAWRASGAASVIAATSAIPSGPVVQAVFPLLSLLLRPAAVRRFAIGRVARTRVPERRRPSEFSWGHAEIRWADGTTREGWLRLGDAQHFTEGVAAEVARRLVDDHSRPGAYTPGARFGAALATDVGAEFVGER